MINHKLFEKLKKFTVEQSFMYDVTLTRETALETDLGICGDDAVDFLIAFGKEFSVDVSNFMFGDYFDGEGMPIVLRARKVPKKTLNLGHLERAVIAGILDESVIANVNA